MMKIRPAHILLFSGAFLEKQAVAQTIKKDVSPNIIIIMADDMGFSDIGCYGGEINTPNIDLLAKNGVRFRQFYNGARSCPTRASLMTGLYPHQAGIGHMTNDPENPTEFDYHLPGYRGDLNHHCMTIAEVLKGSGYQTYMSGKWHLGFTGSEKWPLQRGFDKFYGILAGGTNYFAPSGKRGLSFGNEPVEPGENFYLTDALTDHAIEFVQSSKQKPGNPFFLYLAYTSPHWPLHALKVDIDKYRGKYMKGWSEVRDSRLRKMKEIGLLDNNIELSEQAGPDWESLSEEKKQEMDLRMAIYAAQIDRMDQNVGRLLKTLNEMNVLDNTIIFFLSDNGACAEGGMLGGGLKENLESNRGWVLSYGQAWANVSNTPFKEYKHWVHEGGISTPLIVRWPKGIPAGNNGNWVNAPGFLPDIMATIVDVTQSKYPSRYKGNEIYKLAGTSMAPLLNGKKSVIHKKPIFWEHEGNGAVLDGDYKLVKKQHSNDVTRWELYNLRSDRAEKINLADSMPQKVQRLEKLYQEWAAKSFVVDWKQLMNQKK